MKNTINLGGVTSSKKIDVTYIKNLISSLGFNTTAYNIYEKHYSQFNYTISINFETEKIHYSNPITLGDETTSNFASSENFVVLECVDRLLSIGYHPSSITLENKWSMGRTNKGKLDILIKDKNQKSYLMIECKTWGDEYKKEKNRMLKDGGQLISYYQQDRNAQYLCLYTSIFNNNTTNYISDIIKIEEEFKNLADVKEVYQRWNKQFSQNGIFNEEPYRIKLKALTKKDLKELKKQDSSIIYNQFLEILRHNVVSDKANAFNKIFNLFLCKVLDEDKSDNDQLAFQWVEGKDDEKSLLSRLNDLYKEGMKKYLHKEITDYNQEDVKDYKNNQKIVQILEELRLYKNQEFAFLEVFNENSFKDNARIVKEVVQLLQGWQIRYTHKQQFLGEFFELLLNTGFKQESGQFFTPVPLVRFILKSLPIKELIEEKVTQGEDNFLPYLIDFACGSGHFLTEAMDIIQEHINTFENHYLTNTQSKKLKHFKEGDFEWAKEFIYGIEKDYRLVKTTKLACFLHGDGEAQIIHASGLDNFGEGEYKGKLEKKHQFDILVANPPYSVSGFRSMVKNGSTFKLFADISDNSSEIEVLFIERMLQLLKPKGIAAIILPSSILSKGNNYEKARELILSNFEIKAIVNIGSGGFMATGTSTVTLFLKKLEQPILLENKLDYQKMSINKKILIVNSGENKEQEEHFLGYKFSNRRGDEGLKRIDSGLLYDEENRFNQEFASNYVLNAMLGNYNCEVSEQLQNHITIMSLNDCFDFNREPFSNSIQTKKKIQISSKYKLARLGEFMIFKPKSSYPASFGKDVGKYPFFTSSFKIKYCDVADYNEEHIIIGDGGHSSVHLAREFSVSDHNFVLCTITDTVINSYIYYFFLHCFDYLQAGLKGMALQNISKKYLQDLQIPIPPIEVQKKIIHLIEEQNRLINKYKFDIKNIETVVKFLVLDIQKGNKLKIKDILTLEYGINLPKEKRNQGNYLVVGSNGCIGYHNEYVLDGENIVIGRKGSAGEVNYYDKPITPIDTTFYVKLLTPDMYKLKYIYYILKYINLPQYKSGLGSTGINRNFIYNLEIHLADTIKQREILKEIKQNESKIIKLEELIIKAKNKQKQIIKDTLNLQYKELIG